MEDVLGVLDTLKWSSVPQELSGSDGKVHTRILVHNGTTSVFVDQPKYSGTAHFVQKEGYESLTIHKNNGRWTPKQRQTLERLGFTLESNYATRRNVP